MNATATLPFPAQRQFTLASKRDSELGPIALMDGVRLHLPGCDEDNVMELVWDKQLVAFNIARANTKKVYLAVWSKSLLGLKDLRSKAARETAPIKLDFYSAENPCAFDVVNDIFGHRRDTLGLTEVRVAFCVSSTHIHHLIVDKLLTSTGGDKVSKAPTIWRASVVEFLKSRRL